MSKKKMVADDGHRGYVLFISYIGAVIYFLDRNGGFWGGLLAFLQEPSGQPTSYVQYWGLLSV